MDDNRSYYMRDLDFHVATEEEAEEIRNMQHRNSTKKWIKRIAMSFVAVGIFMIFQLIARQTVPHMFGSSKPAERMIKNCIYVFLGFNILSWLELSLEKNVFFNIEKDHICKATVIRKDCLEVDNVIRSKFLFVTVSYEGHFVLDRVWVRGRLDYGNIKEGQDIYIERFHDDGHYQYYFLA